MNVNLSSSAVNLFNSAQQKTATAGKELTSLPMQKNEVGSADFKSGDITNAVLSLKSAEFETSAATKLTQDENKTLGSIIDLTA